MADLALEQVAYPRRRNPAVLGRMVPIRGAGDAHIPDPIVYGDFHMLATTTVAMFGGDPELAQDEPFAFARPPARSRLNTFSRRWEPEAASETMSNERRMALSGQAPAGRLDVLETYE